MSATVVGEKRQVTVPQEILDAAGLEVGDRVWWQVEDGEIRIRKFGCQNPEVLDMQDADPETLLPHVGRIRSESLLESLHGGRERRR